MLAVFGVVLGAWYMLWLVQRTFFGPLREPVGEGHAPVRDLAFREVAALGHLPEWSKTLDRLVKRVDKLEGEP